MSDSVTTFGESHGPAISCRSGADEGNTTGTPIALLIRNVHQRSKDYAQDISSTSFLAACERL